MKRMNDLSSRRWQIFSVSAVIRHFGCLGIFEKVDVKVNNGLEHEVTFYIVHL